MDAHGPWLFGLLEAAAQQFRVADGWDKKCLILCAPSLFATLWREENDITTDGEYTGGKAVIDWGDMEARPDQRRRHGFAVYQLKERGRDARVLCPICGRVVCPRLRGEPCGLEEVHWEEGRWSTLS